MQLGCILQHYADDLKKAFRTSGITVSQLEQMSSKDRREFFEKAIGDAGKDVNALFEKALLSNQKQAISNWLWKHLYNGVPLYKGITPQQAESLSRVTTMHDLQKMSKTDRETLLAKHLDPSVVPKILTSYETLKQSGNLKNWEQRVLGTKSLYEDARIKGAFAKLEALNELGVLNPKQLNSFMEDFVAMKLGVTVTPAESAEIARLTTDVSETYLKADTDWTADNAKNVKAYYHARHELDKYVKKLDPENPLTVFTDVGARGSMLMAAASLVNSVVYQIPPVIMRALTKRVTSAPFITGDSGVVDRILTAVKGTLSTPEVKRVLADVKLGVEIYKDTGYDIARSDSLDDGFHLFGEKFTHIEGPTLREAKGISGKLKAAVRTHARVMTFGLKYLAGGTDVIFANLHRADTTSLLARTYALAEVKAGKITDTDVAARTEELYKDAYRIEPKTEEGQYIREQAIEDAHQANFTHDGAYGQFALAVRNALNKVGGPVKIGSLIEPFVKIPANALGVSFEAMGPGLILGAKDIIQGVRMEASPDKNAKIANGLARMITAGGVLGAALFLTALLDDDDFISAFDQRNSKGELAEARNAKGFPSMEAGNFVRIGGKWFSLKWFGPLGLPIAGIMHARQQRAQGKSAVLGYGAGMLAGLMEMPGLKTIKNWGESGIDAARKLNQGDTTSAAKEIGATPSNLGKWLAVRTLTSFATYDAYGMLQPYKYDAFGRRLPHRADDVGSAVTAMFLRSNVREDKSNDITDEFEKLKVKGVLPVLTDPTGKYAKELEKKIGAMPFADTVNNLKKNYANEIWTLIHSSEYLQKTPAEKKKTIDKVRDEQILNPIENLVKYGRQKK